MVSRQFHHTEASNFCKQMSPLRIICRIFWPNTISNAALLNLKKEEPTLLQIKWLRKPPDSISRMALECNPQGSRGRGRPKQTWRRSMLNELANANITWDGAKKNSTESYPMEEPCRGLMLPRVKLKNQLIQFN